MKPRKVIGYMTVAIAALAIGAFIYDAHFSRRAVIGKVNERKARQLEIGMSAGAVFKIMGPPEESYPGDYGNSSLTYKYPSSNDDYIPIEIVFDSGRIVKIDVP